MSWFRVSDRINWRIALDVSVAISCVWMIVAMVRNVAAGEFSSAGLNGCAISANLLLRVMSGWMHARFRLEMGKLEAERDFHRLMLDKLRAATTVEFNGPTH